MCIFYYSLGLTVFYVLWFFDKCLVVFTVRPRFLHYLFFVASWECLPWFLFTLPLSKTCNGTVLVLISFFISENFVTPESLISYL